MAEILKSDPPLRKDGHCVQCGKKRKPPKNYKYRAEWNADPFCSATCAKAWHGVVYPSELSTGRAA